MASSILRLSMFLGKLPPEALDAIFPHGPVLSHRSRAADLNPQPLPPKEQLLVASAAVAHDIAFAAVSAEAAGTGSAARLVARAVDDWCGTRPRPLPDPVARPLAVPVAARARAAPRLGHRPVARGRRPDPGLGRLAAGGGRAAGRAGQGRRAAPRGGPGLAAGAACSVRGGCCSTAHAHEPLLDAAVEPRRGRGGDPGDRARRRRGAAGPGLVAGASARRRGRDARRRPEHLLRRRRRAAGAASPRAGRAA